MSPVSCSPGGVLALSWLGTRTLVLTVVLRSFACASVSIVEPEASHTPTAP
ncbi:MAG TPA: hypothetical protein VJ761_06735 [Ktedonobacteraceae bacterium]|nr:hypothetical protein [Ktedonobacteraceae bacterium]